MSTLSVVGAVKDRYNSLTNVPTLYTFDAPPNVDAAQVFVPYSVLLDDGTTPSYEFEHTVMEQTTFTLVVYAPTLNDVDTYVERVKYNGGAIDAGLGLDFGALPTLDTVYKKLEVRRMSEKRFAASRTGRGGERVHACEMVYRVTLYRYS